MDQTDRMATPDTVRMVALSSLHGIGLTSLSLRYIPLPSYADVNANGFQQILWDNAQEIAASYPDDQKGQYQAAAVTFRIPYWDWALNPEMPSTLTDAQISINTPTGQQTIDNPLHQYAFHPQPSEADFPRGQAPVCVLSSVLSSKAPS